MGFSVSGIVYQKAVKTVDFNTFEFFQAVFEHLQALFKTKKVLFVGIVQNRHNNPIKYF